MNSSPSVVVIEFLICPAGDDVEEVRRIARMEEVFASPVVTGAHRLREGLDLGGAEVLEYIRRQQDPDRVQSLRTHCGIVLTACRAIRTHRAAAIPLRNPRGRSIP